MQSRILTFLCVIDTCSNYAWFVSLRVKKVITIINAFQNISDESNCKQTNKQANIKTQKHFCKRFPPNWSEEVFLIKRFKILFH